MAAPKKVDYERIEPGWRAGIKSPAQLAAEYTKETGVSVSHAAIIKHFKKLGVPRDLKAKVHAKAESMVMQAMVTGKVSAVTTVKDAEIIENEAAAVAHVRITHRTDIMRARKLSMKLLAELESQTENVSLFEQLSEILHDSSEGADSKRQELFAKVLSLPSRTKTMKELSESLRILIGLEREAYDLSNVGGQGEGAQYGVLQVPGPATSEAWEYSASVQQPGSGPTGDS